MTTEEPRKYWCPKCPQRGRLLPLRKGQVVCVECNYQMADAWGLTDGLAPGDFDGAAQYARQLRAATRRQRGECQHRRVAVAVRPYCSDCGLVLPRDHPLARAALDRVADMARVLTPELVEQLMRGNAAGLAKGQRDD